MQVFLPNKLYKLNKKVTLIEKVNYSKESVADLSTLQSKKMYYISTLLNILFKKKNPTKKKISSESRIP